MSTATRADLLRASPRRYDSLLLPVSGLTVRFRSLTEAEYAAWQLEALDTDESEVKDNKERVRTTRPRLIVKCLCDDEGRRILTDDDAKDLPELMDAADSSLLFDRLQEFCGIDRRPSVRIQEAKKNSSVAGGSDSSAVSRSPVDATTSDASPQN